MQIANGKIIAQNILNRAKKKIKTLKKKPAIGVVLVGDDKASHTYVKMKGKRARDIGLNSLIFSYPATIKKEKLIAEIKKIQAKNRLSGLMVQLPLPKHLQKHTREITNHINPDIDIDCMSHVSLGQVLMGENKLIPPTPGAMLEILKYYKVDMVGKEVCIIGRGDLVGKPLAAMLACKPVVLVSCDKHTPDISVYTRRADIIFTGVGKKNLITGKMIKKSCVVIDAGVNFDNGKIHGDIEYASVAKKASLVTPTPGGVGPITIAKLLENTIKAHRA